MPPGQAHQRNRQGGRFKESITRDLSPCWFDATNGSVHRGFRLIDGAEIIKRFQNTDPPLYRLMQNFLSRR